MEPPADNRKTDEGHHRANEVIIPPVNRQVPDVADPLAGFDVHGRMRDSTGEDQPVVRFGSGLP